MRRVRACQNCDITCDKKAVPRLYAVLPLCKMTPDGMLAIQSENWVYLIGAYSFRLVEPAATQGRILSDANKPIDIILFLTSLGATSSG